MSKKIKKLIIVVVCVTAICVVGFIAVIAPYLALKGVGVPDESLVVVLDAGHGGIDSGVIGNVTQVKESDLNLLTCFELKKQLEARGATVVMTRKTKDGLYGDTKAGFKRRDMQKRREIITSAGASLVLSIHMNKFSDVRRSGPQVFYQAGEVGGKKLAETLQIVLNEFTGNEHSAIGGDFYVCRCSKVPSVIVECGFLSNAEEEKLLCDAKYREKLCQIVLKGVFLYLFEGK